LCFLESSTTRPLRLDLISASQEKKKQEEKEGEEEEE
jgi:hypothetical protein